MHVATVFAVSALLAFALTTMLLRWRRRRRRGWWRESKHPSFFATTDRYPTK